MKDIAWIYCYHHTPRITSGRGPWITSGIRSRNAARSCGDACGSKQVSDQGMRSGAVERFMSEPVESSESAVLSVP